ncbi:MAG: ABC transporter ATP-binding protein/permease, partial [Oscillospiraceae bacterium]|nr:ABC transporter ATP-binding protein/permease [Oscillospiraceae bacterium]
MNEQRREHRRHGPGHGPGGPIGMPAEKPKNMGKALSQLLRYCRKYLPAIVFALVASIAGTVFQVIGPDKVKEMTAEIQKVFSPPNFAIDMEAVRAVLFTLVGFYAASAVLGYIQHFIMATVTTRISQKLRGGISDKINRIPLKFFDKQSHGDVISRITNDVDTIGMTLNQSISTLVSAVVMLAGSIVMMFATNWLLALTAIGSSLLGFAIVSVIMVKSQKHFVAQQKGLGDINGHIEEIYANHNIVKAYNGGNAAKAAFERFNESLYASGWKSQFLSGLMMPVMMFTGNLGYVAVCVVGASLAVNNPAFFSVIVAFMIYVRLFTQPLSQIAQGIQSMQRAAAASERVFDFFGEEELSDENWKTETFRDVRGDVEFSHVRFGYDPEKIIIHDFSAHVPAGKKIAIIGPTGAGKTTMVNLLMRFYEVNGGEILIDGIPTSSVTRQNVHDQFCMVLQDTWLFEGTIKENIIYSKEGVTDEQVIEACKAVSLHHFINTLPEGYDTVLNDKASLS